jgi:hypothetical protein
MSRFAVGSISPRSIAWLVRPNDWKRFERIIKYNCAILGGYFNVIIPVSKDLLVDDRYDQFLIDMGKLTALQSAIGSISCGMEAIRVSIGLRIFAPASAMIWRLSRRLTATS